MTEDKKPKKTLTVKTPLKTGMRAGSAQPISGVKKKIFQRDDRGMLKVIADKDEVVGEEDSQTGHLSKAERETRMQILARAAKTTNLMAEEKAKILELQAREASQKVLEEKAALELKKTEEERRRLAEVERKQKEELVRRKFEQTAKQAGIGELDDELSEKPNLQHKGKPSNLPKLSIKKGKSNREEKRRSNTVNIARMFDAEGESLERQRSIASIRRARNKDRLKAAQSANQQEKIYREVILPETITVGDLSNRMSERLQDVIKVLMRMGVMATQQMVIDADTAELIITELGHKVKRVAESDVEIILEDKPDLDSDLRPRPPVVTVMGHVDHGKTSLLDALRQTDIATDEAGGITQHIGATMVHLQNNRQITFLDTPGHEAFTALRARGAVVTDIVVLVVAADDGIRPQTVEAIHHAKAAQVPIVVAINKCDKPEAEPNRVRQELLQHEVVVEDLGGEVQAVEVSAKTKMNLDKLEEAILLQAEILDLRANPNRPARGVVIESKIETGRGPVATVIIKKGTLQLGDVFVMGTAIGRVRALLNDKGQQIKQAMPGMPVEVLGAQSISEAGHDLVVLADEQKAKEIVDYRTRKKREADMIKMRRGSMEQMFADIKAGAQKNLPLVVKTDVQGSLEALQTAFEKIGTAEVKVNILHAAVGAITESDVALATSSHGLVVGFNVRAGPKARENAKRDDVEIRYYSIIYQAIDDLKQLLTGLLAPTMREEFLGTAAVREVFKITGSGIIAGVMVEEGVMRRGSQLRLIRDHVVIHEGALRQLKRFKEDVKEVGQGYECGIQIERFEDIKIGDKIESFEVKSIARSL